MKSTIKFLVLTMLLVIAIAAFAGCAKTVEHTWAEATCSTPKTCTDCGAVEGEALGHTEQILEGKAATCTETGLTEGKSCSVCEAIIVAQEEIPALGHDMITDAPQTATCTEAGLTEGAHCSRCDYKVEQTEVPALGHDMVTDAAVAPTCTADGLTEGSHCSRCDEKVAQETIPATGHNIVVDAAKAPTCTESGLNEGAHCTKCDYKIAQTSVPALGHDMVTDKAVAPTCTTTGLTEGSHCSRCDEKVAQNVIPALEHAWVDATLDAPKTCTTCGATEGEALAAQAAIGEVKFFTLAEAIAAVKEGEEIVLLGNIALDAPIVIEKDTVVAIDLAGFVLSYESTTMNEAMITNLGSLTIKDSGETGEIFYNYVGEADSTYSKGNYTISNTGTLVIFGGKIHIANLRGHAKYPVNNNSTTGDATLIVYGGHLYNYNTSAIRMFCNSTTYNNTVIIDGGLIEGYCAIWMQNPGKNTVNGQLAIYSGEIRTTAAAYVNGSATVAEVASKIYCTIDGEGGAWSDNSYIDLSGGLFNENVYFAENAPVVYAFGPIFNGYVELPHVHEFVGTTCTEDGVCDCGEIEEAYGHTFIGFSCTDDGVCDCGEIKPAAPGQHNLIYVPEVVATTCLEKGNPEYWYCDVCNLYFGDADAFSQINPGWLFYTGDCQRPEGLPACATVSCVLCGEDVLPIEEHYTGVAICQNGTCSECGAFVEGWGCENYDTPACEDGFCSYCGGFVAGFGHENGAWAPCEDGECSYGCGLFYPATEDHTDEDGDGYCDACWNHINHEYGPCGGYCTICWNGYVETTHEYMFACDAHCMKCGELTNEDAAHSITFIEGYAANCTANGMADRYECSLCGYCWLDEGLTLVANRMNVVIPATGHAYFYACDAHCMNCYELTNENAAHTIVAVEAKAATCTADGNVAYWTCSDCGAAWLDEALTLVANRMSVVTPTIDHADENGDYKCDGCSTKMLPADGTALTIPQAIAIAKLAGSSYTTQKYYITGIVTNVYNTTYGNLYLKDADGNQICIYGLYTYDGSTRYDAMSYKPVEGDELTVYTVLGTYNSAAQGKNAWMDEVVAHEHNYASVVTDPTCTKAGYTTHTCSICQGYYVDSEVEALGHTTENGVCERCELTIGGDVVNNETFTADLTTLSTSTSYGSYKTTSGWQTTNCAVVGGGTSNSNPKFICIGDASNRGVVLNGKTSAKGKLVSSTLTGGISAITFQYTNVFSESKGVDITITIKQNGVAVATKKLDDNSVTQYTAETFTWDLVAEGVAVKGDFTIEISNNSPSNSSSNKDRVAIWNIAWTTNY